MAKQIPATISVVFCFCISLVCAFESSASCPDSESIPAMLDSQSITVATVNLAHGRNDSFNQILLNREEIEQNLSNIASQISATGAHAWAVQEADAASRWSGKFDHVAFLAAAGKFPCYFHGLHDESSWSNYGTAILARTTLTGALSHRFAPSWPTKPKGFVLSQLAWNPGNALQKPLNLVVVSVHLDFSRDSVRLKQVGEMIDTLSQIEAPLVVMGDFNADWSKPDSAVRVLVDKLQLHAFEPESDKFSTYPADDTRLDWILLSRQLEFLRHEVLKDPVSDHLAVVAEIIVAVVPSDPP